MRDLAERIRNTPTRVNGYAALSRCSLLLRFEYSLGRSPRAACPAINACPGDGNLCPRQDRHGGLANRVRPIGPSRWLCRTHARSHQLKDPLTHFRSGRARYRMVLKKDL
jgi:hypothetical protein